MGYNKTPSFYEDQEFFDNFLGNTSYYAALQRVIHKLIRLSESYSVLELGCALGTTMNALAASYPSVGFTGVDNRADVIEEARAVAGTNTNYVAADMCDVVKVVLDYDLIYMLYSFHHIEDPLQKKITFLKDCYRNMMPGAHIVIAETFLPEASTISELWDQRAAEGYASTFWSSLEGLTQDDISAAISAADTCAVNEVEAGKLVDKRENEYLVKVSWLVSMLKDVGFTIVAQHPVNCVNDWVIVARKE